MRREKNDDDDEGTEKITKHKKRGEEEKKKRRKKNVLRMVFGGVYIRKTRSGRKPKGDGTEAMVNIKK